MEGSKSLQSGRSYREGSSQRRETVSGLREKAELRRYWRTFQHCRKLLANCLDDDNCDHRKCTKPLAGGIFASVCPTRLIDVGSDTVPARLVKFESLADVNLASQGVRTRGDFSSRAKFPGYAALSYCWGPTIDKRHLLRAENEDSFMRALPQLPKTLRDAVLLCRGIGIRYLWIDALCIVQGHNETSSDWQKESARVGSYYANALFTIAASWASTSDDGCLQQNYYQLRDLWTSLGRILCLCSADDGRWASIEEERALQDHPAYTSSKLVRRGWVMQELILSARVLWIHGENTLWTCGGCVRTIDRKTSPFFGYSDFRVNLKYTWYYTIEEYMTCSLSFSEDLLPALSGLCKYADSRGSDTYLAGIWKSSLLWGLTWYTEENTHERSAAHNSTLPSWSPLSCRGRVKFYQVCREESICEFSWTDPRVVNVDVRLRYDDPYGGIVSAALDISVLLFSARFTLQGGRWGLMKFDDGLVIKGDLYMDDPQSMRQHETGPLINAILISHQWSSLGSTLSRGTKLRFLLLKKIKESEAYVRIGIFESETIYYWHHWHDLSRMDALLRRGHRRQIKFV